MMRLSSVRYRSLHRVLNPNRDREGAAPIASAPLPHGRGSDARYRREGPMPRTFRLFSFIVALLLLLTACGETRPTGKPAAGEKPAAEKPAAEKPAADKPAADKPTAEKAAPAAATAGNEIVFGA